MDLWLMMFAALLSSLLFDFLKLEITQYRKVLLNTCSYFEFSALEFGHWLSFSRCLLSKTYKPSCLRWRSRRKAYLPFFRYKKRTFCLLPGRGDRDHALRCGSAEMPQHAGNSLSVDAANFIAATRQTLNVVFLLIGLCSAKLFRRFFWKRRKCADD